MENNTGIVELSDRDLAMVSGGFVVSTFIVAVGLGIYIGSRIWP